MADQNDVRRIALGLPEASEGEDGFGFSVPNNKGKAKGFCWTWNERVEPKRPKVPNPGVLAVRVPNVGEKEALIAAEPEKYFTEPHYNGYPAVLVRLANVPVDELEELLIDAWRCMAAPALVQEYDQAQST
ncbi:MmcQ/YjbR family DNA-binding protein [Flindersiella endophytica]